MLEGFIVKEFDELASTQDYAKELLNGGSAQHGMVISTNSQTSGRGRGVKSWLSNPGNLAITIILKSALLRRIHLQLILPI